MKKKIINLYLMLLFIIFPVKVLASGNITVSPSSLNIEVGSSKTFIITANNTIGDVTISSSNNNVARVSTGEWGTGMVDEGQIRSGSITVTGVSEGTARITLNIDAATFDGEDLSGQKRTISINVIPKSTPANNNNSNSTNNTNNSNNSNNTSNNKTNRNKNNITNNQSVNNDTPSKSTNNRISELSIEGYELLKVDDNNYTTTVGYDITDININATPEDSKSNIVGTGNHELNIGENNIEITVISESGAENKINIKVIKKDGYYLEDLEKVLKNSEITSDIIIKNDTIISKEDINSIKESKRSIKFSYFDDNKKIIYSWILDGSKIDIIEEMKTNISFETENSENISKLSNYADGIYINLAHKGNLPSGTILKIYVGNKYKNDDTVNIYYYDNENLNIIRESVIVEDGYIEFTPLKGSDYFVSKSKLNNFVANEDNQVKSSKKIIIIITLIIIFIIVLVVILILKNKKSKNNKTAENNLQREVNSNQEVLNSNINANTMYTNSTTNINNNENISINDMPIIKTDNSNSNNQSINTTVSSNIVSNTQTNNPSIINNSTIIPTIKNQSSSNIINKNEQIISNQASNLSTNNNLENKAINPNNIVNNNSNILSNNVNQVINNQSISSTQTELNNKYNQNN